MLMLMLMLITFADREWAVLEEPANRKGRVSYSESQNYETFFP